MTRINTLTRYIALGLVLVSLGGCEPNVYASIGVSAFGDHHSNSRVHGNISVGGRICC